MSTERIIRLSRSVPEGKWTTYGTISEIVYGHRRGAQTVGSVNPCRGQVDSAHRTLNAGGKIAPEWRGVGGGEEECLRRLRRERIWDDSRDRRSPGSLHRRGPAPSAGALTPMQAPSAYAEQSGWQRVDRGAPRSGRAMTTTKGDVVTTLMLVLDYPAMGHPEKRPQRRHRADCPHPYREPPLGPPIWRQTTDAEMRSVPPCQDCLRKDNPA